MIYKLQLFLIISSILFSGAIFYMLKKEIIALSYSLLWIFISFAMIFIVVKPQIIFNLSEKIGIIEPVNAMFFISIIFILTINFSLTVALSRNSLRVKTLAQEISLLNNKIDSLMECQNKNKNIK